MNDSTKHLAAPTNPWATTDAEYAAMQRAVKEADASGDPVAANDARLRLNLATRVRQQTRSSGPATNTQAPTSVTDPARWLALHGLTPTR